MRLALIETHRLEEILGQFSQVRVAVLGDFFLDLYIQLDRSLSELSLETQKEAFQAVGLRGQPGAAGVVTSNLAALGAQCAAIGYTGRDGNGYTLRQALAERGVNLDFLIESPARFTPTYTKPMMREVGGENIELNRMDIINRTPNSPTLNQRLTDNLRVALETWDGLLVVEQVRQDGFGTLSPLVREALAEVSAAHPDKIMIVDSRYFAAQYKKVSLKMNLAEAARATSTLQPGASRLDLKDPLKAAQAGAEILGRTNPKPLYITLGEQGIAGITGGQFFHWPGFQMDGPMDIVGAGDSVLAGIGLARCAGATAIEAAYIGNLVGSITVQQLGTTGIATREDILKRHYEYQKQISA